MCINVCVYMHRYMCVHNNLGSGNVKKFSQKKGGFFECQQNVPENSAF